MQIPDLNLARKWRSKNFDQIIGQDLCVRILKNSLYLNSFFPVYLFSGQRGCGKTSTARIFAAAINCEELDTFQKNAKSLSIPCLKCISCESMQKGNHPDFIEIDAASNTGVDNVRNIIEASTLLPLIGKKKIYLIDEAHMLSKAAFNAFLKILEEPPASVLFILATTDVQKIIDTVKSRSFHLFFSSISSDSLLAHLKKICQQESIEYELDALAIIVRESEGSARDAINLLEQVRFSNHIVNKSSVLSSLGHLSDEQILILFDILINKKNIKEFLNFLDEINFYKFSAEFIWNKFLELLRLSIRIKYDINISKHENLDKLKEISSKTTLNYIIHIMNELCKNELIFNKSINKNLFLELLFLRILNQNLFNESDLDFKKKITNPKVDIELLKSNTFNDNKNEISKNTLWDSFVDEIKVKNDPLLVSIFGQAKFIKFDNSNNQILISFAERFTFFKELIEDTKTNWEETLKKIFNKDCSLVITFEQKDNNQIISIEKKNYNNAELIKNNNSFVQTNMKDKSNFSDKEKWKMTNILLKSFPGIIIQQEENNE